MLVDGRGVALSLVVSEANRPDVSQLEIVLDEIVIERPDDIEHSSDVPIKVTTAIRLDR